MSRAVAEWTPMLRHYLELKALHPDAVLLYRMGDFFEIFFEDAVRAAPILEVTLTARQKGTENEAPMCGVPHHALEPYLAKLLRAGLKVAICDQVEDPAQAKGLVRREVTRVVTPGTASGPGLVEGREENLLAAVVWPGGEADRRGPREGAGAFLEVSTGSFFVRRWRDEEMAREDLRVLRPREVLIEADREPKREGWLAGADAPCWTPLEAERFPDARRASETLERQFRAATLRGFGLVAGEPAVRAAAAALLYAEETQRRALDHVREIGVRDEDDALLLDATTLANLDVLPSAPGGRGASLFAVVDRTVTSPGARLLRDWLRRPLRQPEAIGRRLRAVAELKDRGDLRDRLRRRLARLPDFERLLGRAVLGALTPREAAALRDGLAEVPGWLEDLSTAAAPALLETSQLDPLAGLAEELRRWLLEAPAAQIKDGGVIAEGVDAELDAVRSLARDSKGHVLAVEQRERQRTGIGSLKIRYNRVFGYSIEISKAHQRAVPPDYERRQTLVNAERYVTPEIRDLETRILGAEARQIALEEEHFARLRATVAAGAVGLARLGRAVAQVDVLAGFAEIAAREAWCEPRITPAGGALRLVEGRHPVVEKAVSDRRDPFVPNDVDLEPSRAQVVVLTGPNMGGKSTYLRQAALAVLLAQAGCFVPAAEAEVSVVDRIFSRVGASDDLARGESTFMVEMIETANILRRASSESLVILDEVGRGTATFDGLSLAWAIVEHLHERVGAKTLFATHYHELTELAGYLPRVVNRTMAVKEWEDRIVFLRRVVPGRADRSYGLHVARLAGVPETVLRRAAEILGRLEAQEFDAAGQPRIAAGGGAPAAPAAQLALFSPADEVVVKILREADLDQLTPLGALNLLHALRGRLEGR